MVKQGIMEAACWLGGGVLLTALLWGSGADDALARAVYEPHSWLGHAVRNYGTWPGALLLMGCMLASLWPCHSRKVPQWRLVANTVVLTALLAGGLLNQVLVQDLVDRPRPRESVLRAADATVLDDKLIGNSMPSGHAAMGFVLAVPFFVLRRRHPAVAAGFLALGLAAGAGLGYGRMLLGAHYASDVVMAGAIEMAGGALFGALLASRGALRVWHVAMLLVLGLGGLVLGNRFTTTLVYEAHEPWRSIDLPCVLNAVPMPAVQVPTLEVRVTGFGAPVTSLALRMDRDGVIGLRRWGVYWGMGCTGVVRMPY